MVNTSQLASQKYRLLLFPGVWFLVNIFQAAFTELNPDEAYYWSYSRELDWGYYDHPPAIALMIRIGTFFLPGEAGVRLMSVVLSTLSIFLIWILLDRPKKIEAVNLISILFAAMPFLHVYAFIATPDGPLLFFCVLFFLLYKYFLEKPDSWWLALAWGACMAALLYSKYHGILVIGFTVLSNLRLLRMPRFYAAALFGALLFLPHIYWQFDHGFPSFRYHLLQRNNPFQPKDLYYYLLNQLLIFNPFVFPFLAVALVRQTKSNFFPDRILKNAFLFLIYGFWLFFLLTVIRGHVEPHWLAVLSISFIALTYYYSLTRDKFRRQLTRAALFSLVFISFFRIAILKGVLGEKAPLFNTRQWTYALAREVDNAPVLFLRNFREPSMYSFYTNNEAYNLTDIFGVRQSQYQLWDWEKALQGRKVAILGDPDWHCSDGREVTLHDFKRKIKWADNFQVSQAAQFRILRADHPWLAGNRQKLTVEIFNPYDHDIHLKAGNMPLRPAAFFVDEKKKWAVVYLEFDVEGDVLPSRKPIRQEFDFDVPSGLTGAVHFGMGIQTGDIPPVWQSDVTEIRLADANQ